MDWVMKHKGILVTSILVLLLIVLILFVKWLFFTGNGMNEYGNRLEGIEKVKINEDTLSKMVQDIMATGQVKQADYRLEGRLLNFVVDVHSDVVPDTAKSFVDFVLTQLTKEQLGYYDIQFYIVENTNENNNYPLIGYKHKTSDGFVW